MSTIFAYFALVGRPFLSTVALLDAREAPPTRTLLVGYLVLSPGRLATCPTCDCSEQLATGRVQAVQRALPRRRLGSVSLRPEPQLGSGAQRLGSWPEVRSEGRLGRGSPKRAPRAPSDVGVCLGVIASGVAIRHPRSRSPHPLIIGQVGVWPAMWESSSAFAVAPFGRLR